ncbi:unnamed protein product [Linum trigynum]|uniref:Uncharacterized protein n=1 Tax=Linum trigynum TaxID=586398 RepID=A0AAV2CT52_9ROSI
MRGVNNTGGVNSSSSSSRRGGMRCEFFIGGLRWRRRGVLVAGTCVAVGKAGVTAVAKIAAAAARVAISPFPAAQCAAPPVRLLVAQGASHQDCCGPYNN